MKKEWSQLEQRLKALRYVSPSPHLKERILGQSIHLKIQKVTLIDKLWFSRFLRVSWISVMMILILIGVFSDREINTKLSSHVQKGINLSKTEQNLLAKELGFKSQESMFYLRHSFNGRETWQEQMKNYLEKEIHSEEL